MLLQDAFLSGPQRWDATTCMQSGPYTKPEWWGLQDPNPELNVIVASLSAGPVAPGDGIGDTNAEVVMRSCAADGTLLKPDRPAFALDSVWRRFVFGSGGPDGEVSQTTTTFGSHTWRHVLAAGVKDRFIVNGTALGGNHDPTPTIAWKRPMTSPSRWGTPAVAGAPVRLSELELEIPSGGQALGNFTLWHTAPVSCNGNGWTLLGEFGKVVPVSRHRITSYIETCGGIGDATLASSPGIELLLTGAPGERVMFAFVKPQSASVQVVTGEMDSSGVAHMRVGPQSPV